MISVRDRLAQGHYENRLPYPSRPKTPAVLNKVASRLTTEEMAMLPQARAEYDRALTEVKDARDAWNERNSEVRDQLRADLEAENGMTGHAKAELLWQKAWEQGHSSGLGDVVTAYEDLVDLAR